jgi:hypothetical protein
MRNLRYILLLAVVLFYASVACAQSAAKRELKETEKKAAAERDRAFGGKRTHTTLDQKKAPQNVQPGASNENDQKQASKETSSDVVTSNKDQNQSTETTGKNTNPDRSNSSAVNETTTSEAGSPAILSENDGEGRDGTNNRQRGTYKMAGAEIKRNMGLSEDEKEKNIKTPKKVLKEEEQPALVRDRSETPETTDSNVSPAQQTGEQQSVEQPTKKEPAKTKKSKKSKRNRDRDSGR